MLYTFRRSSALVAAASAAVLLFCAAGAHAQQALFQLDGMDYGSEDLPAAVRQSLFDAELEHYRAQRRLAEDGAVTVYLEHEAQRQGKSVEAVSAELLPPYEPSDAEIQAFYDANRQRIPYGLDQVRGQIENLLRERALAESRSALVTELESKGALNMLVVQPQPPQVDIDISGRPSKGAADAPVTLVEFSDFQCPHCKHASPVMNTLLDRYGDRLRVVYMDFPINPSGISTKVSEGGYCAAQQDRFWEYHDLAFEQQSTLKADSALALAGKLGLDEELFLACLEDPATVAAIAEVKAEAERLGISATPTFYVNGQRAVLEDLVGGLRAAIDQALADQAGQDESQNSGS